MPNGKWCEGGGCVLWTASLLDERQDYSEHLTSQQESGVMV